MHLEKALSQAFETQDSIKDSIWRELAACKLAFWEQQATVREDKRQRLRTRMGMIMDAYFLAHPEVCSTPARSFGSESVNLDTVGT